MDLVEHQSKYLLAGVGVRVPRGEVVTSAAGAELAAARLGGRVVCKAQLPAGGRGKAGLVRFAASPAEAGAVAESLLGRSFGGAVTDTLLVEQAADVGRELYAGVLDDPASKGPLVLFSTAGGMDVEQVGRDSPNLLRRMGVDIREGLTPASAESLLERTDLDPADRPAVADALVRLYTLYRRCDATLVEVNPLAVTGPGQVIALDAKVSLDPAALPRHGNLLTPIPGGHPGDTGTALERQARGHGLNFIELDGDIGVLVNGAGLAMTTLDAIDHHGGRAANFVEIGGDAYPKAAAALRLVLANRRVTCLLVNFCGAFARTDVMAAGVVAALEELRPDVPVYFTLHGTGEVEATALVRARLGVEPYDAMDDAVRAVVAAAAGVTG